MTVLNLIQNTTGSTIEYNGYSVDPDDWFGVALRNSEGLVGGIDLHKCACVTSGNISNNGDLYILYLSSGGWTPICVDPTTVEIPIGLTNFVREQVSGIINKWS